MIKESYGERGNIVSTQEAINNKHQYHKCYIECKVSSFKPSLNYFSKYQVTNKILDCFSEYLVLYTFLKFWYDCNRTKHIAE